MGGLFFLQAHAIALWFVPFSSILKEHGLGNLTPWAFATSAVAAFVSPMLAGTLADSHFSPNVVLRWLCTGMAVLLSLTFLAIERGWNQYLILVLIQLFQFCFAPSWGVASTLVLAQLRDPGRQFGPLRAWGTFGWMAAGPLVSLVLHADGSTLPGFVSAVCWAGVAAFTFFLPSVQPKEVAERVSGGSLFGLETFRLLRDPQHRALFLTAGLLSIPLAAFYPYTPMHLQELGIAQVSAAMSLAQVFEAVAMFAMAPILTAVRLRPLFVFAIFVAVLRYVLFGLNARWALITGILMHGICFTLFFIPAQIYVEKRIARELRFRAQALLTLLIGGFGNLFGYLGCGALHSLCSSGDRTDWPLYWGVLAASVCFVGAYFLAAYRSSGSSAGELVATKSTAGC